MASDEGKQEAWESQGERQRCAGRAEKIERMIEQSRKRKRNLERRDVKK